MISSGMKRGLAASAISALAVAGLPFLASSASAATGDSIAVGSTGPIRNGNAAGGTVVLKTKGIDPTKLELANTALTGSPNSPSQTVSIVGTPTLVANGDPGDSNKTDGLDEITVTLAVTTPAAGDTASFAIYEDEDNPADPAVDVDANEARTQATVTTSGAPASVDITPDSQTTAANVASPDYTVTVKDSAGRLTQLVAGESFVVSSTSDAVATGTLNQTTLNDGTATFTATAPTAGSKTLTINGAGAIASTVTDSATLNVIAQATISEDEFDIATGADTWSSTSTFGGPAVQVRVDQGSVTFNFASKDGADLDSTPDDANKLVLFTVNSGTLKFDGQSSKTYPVLLDANGKGSLTVSPTGIVENSSFTFAAPGSGIASTTVQFKRAAASSVTTDAAVYVTKVGSPTTVTVSAKDQFGNPIGAPAQVSIVRGARNGGTETARQTVDANGKATFTLPDAGTTAGTETFSVNLYDDQFDASAVNSAGGTINYTADGLGGDFAITGATSDASATTIKPVTDDNAGVGDSVTLTFAGGTANAPATISVDNGALILNGGTSVDKGASSRTITLDALGAGSVTVVGTKTGVVTATITSAGRTKTVKFTVKQATDGTQVASARNVDLQAPEKANAGGVAVFTATVTDAFGNPVAGVSAGDLNFQISGPANLQNQEWVTDANGEIEYSVILTDNANSTVTGRITAFGNQFGAKATELEAGDGANTAPGFTASQDTDSASIADVVNIKELQEAVDQAQAKVDAAQANLDGANDDLAVAQAEKSVAQKAVKAAKKDLQKAKKKHKGVNAAKAALRNAKGDLTVAKAKVNSAQAKVTRAEAALADAQAELAAAKKALEDAQNG